METRVRDPRDAEANEFKGGTPDGDSELQSLRAEADDLLTAGDDAIGRAISGNSERFLRSVLQQGGQ